MPDHITLYSRNAWVENSFQPVSLVIEDGLIIGLEEKPRSTSTDFGEYIMMPGVIDAHVHINEPGRTEWEGFNSATRAAAAGGITSIVDMPLNSSPVTTTVAALKEKMNASTGQLHVNVGFYGGLIPANVNDIDSLLLSGILGIKCFLTHSGIDEFPNVTEQDLEASMPLISQYGLPLLAHCELSDQLKHSDLSNEPSSYLQYLRSRPDDWEVKAVAMMIDLATKHNCRLHIVHVSSQHSLHLISDAKTKTKIISAETCPHYLFFEAETIPDKQTVYKCAPPIRTHENNLQLKLALKDSILDLLSSDHSPAPPSIKELDSGDLMKAWGGIAGLQFLLPASWTSLKNYFSLEEFIPLLTSRPATLLGLEQNIGHLKEGLAADITVWEPQKKIIVNEEEIFHRHKPTPYIGRELHGEVISTYVNGNLVYNNKQVINLNKGKWLLKK